MGGNSRRALLGAGAGLAVWALLVEPRRLAVERHALRLPDWPEALHGLRLAVVSDLHAGGPHVRESAIDRVVERVNRERPDLMALLGDYVDPNVPLGRRLDPAAVAARLARLDAPLGAVAVLGNHDWENDTGRVVGALRDRGIPVLENSAVPVEGAAAPLWVAGLADLRSRHPDPLLAFSRIPEDAAVLALSHDPEPFPRMPPRAALTVAGHTHGGQVGLPLLRKKAARSGYMGGHHVEGGRHLYVSRGIGSSRLPIRFAAPPEVSILTLRSLAGDGG